MSDRLFTGLPSYGCRSTASQDGYEIHLSWKYDISHGAPWDEEDGHGPVSDWRHHNYMGYPDKRPGERVLCTDRRSSRLYDFEGACRIARRDGWGVADGHTYPTRRSLAAAAVEADFKRLEAWAAQDWYYIGIIVETYKEGVELGSASLWGIESDDTAHHLEVIDDLIEEAGDLAKQTLARLCECVPA